ncbi:hypothetical protein FSP39_003514 [Pinctada imbricata]|uniref:AF-9 ANC1 homology domain-containing protein n=1 Tax=Pinctada imbricata TaxID=66713 RepID=A0AA89BUS3_PINIB|nr:hypothetical protein FSP39_003514 [Pinctada imbricata]
MKRLSNSTPESMSLPKKAKLGDFRVTSSDESSDNSDDEHEEMVKSIIQDLDSHDEDDDVDEEEMDDDGDEKVSDEEDEIGRSPDVNMEYRPAPVQSSRSALDRLMDQFSDDEEDEDNVLDPNLPPLSSPLQNPSPASSVPSLKESPASHRSSASSSSRHPKTSHYSPSSLSQKSTSSVHDQPTSRKSSSTVHDQPSYHKNSSSTAAYDQPTSHKNSSSANDQLASRNLSSSAHDQPSSHKSSKSKHDKEKRRHSKDVTARSDAVKGTSHDVDENIMPQRVEEKLSTETTSIKEKYEEYSVKSSKQENIKQKNKDSKEKDKAVKQIKTDCKNRRESDSKHRIKHEKVNEEKEPKREKLSVKNEQDYYHTSRDDQIQSVEKDSMKIEKKGYEAEVKPPDISSPYIKNEKEFEKDYMAMNGVDRCEEMEELKHLGKAPNGEDLCTLITLYQKLESTQDVMLLQKVIQEIQKTGLYKINESCETFDFDLCELDSSTVEILKNYLCAS